MSATKLYHTWQHLLVTFATNSALIYIVLEYLFIIYETSVNRAVTLSMGILPFTWKVKKGKGSKMQLPTHCVELEKKSFTSRTQAGLNKEPLLDMDFQKIQTKKSRSYKVSQIHPLSSYKLKRNVAVRIPYSSYTPPTHC